MERFMLVKAGSPSAGKPIARKQYGLGNLDVTIEFGDLPPSTGEARAIESFLRPELRKAGLYGP